MQRLTVALLGEPHIDVDDVRESIGLRDASDDHSIEVDKRTSTGTLRPNTTIGCIANAPTSGNWRSRYSIA